MLNYKKILNKNMLNVFKDILINISKNGLVNGQHLYITFLTTHKNVKIPDWLTNKYPEEITIVIEHEYYNLNIYEHCFKITLSFNDIKTDLEIGYDAIISFADPSSDFGLILQTPKHRNVKKKSINKEDLTDDNIINFSKFRKN
tara:strand:+ start:744 stop:1175 length:432 start_codon:yes stop_codon:yes gene_type:complete